MPGETYKPTLFEAERIPIHMEYFWCSGADTSHDIRCKTMSMFLDAAKYKEIIGVGPEVPYEKIPWAQRRVAAKRFLSYLPHWNFDGSSTGQMKAGENTEVEIHPQDCFPNPFPAASPSHFETPRFFVLSDCYSTEGIPTPDNTRALANEVFNKAPDAHPWFGLEQEYVMMKDGRPLGWPKNGFPGPQGPYYCGNGYDRAFGRTVAEKHLDLCHRMGLTISGTNAEVMPGQMEYQVGPCEGIAAGDHLLASRFILLRVMEEAGLTLNVESKPKSGDWNGSGMHCNFSTAPMRAPGGIDAIYEAVGRLEKSFLRDICAYGDDNLERMSGEHETSRLDKFSYGVGTRHTNIRLPRNLLSKRCGYFEDRRPSASADPYMVSGRLFSSACAVESEAMEKYITDHLPTWYNKLAESAEKNA